MSWKLYEKVTIVEKPMTAYNWKEHKIEYTGINQGFVVEYGNKNMLESAMTWAKSNDNPIPNQFDFDNEGFSLTIYDSANGSSQGGKLSFMNCMIEKDGHKFLIGINSDFLVELIQNTTFINGACQSKICFARKDGRVGALTKDMDSYKEAVSYINHSQKVNQKKTTKWIPGHIYETSTTKCRYIGEIYSWYDYTETEYGRYPGYHVASKYFKLRKIPIKKYLICKKVELYGRFNEYYEVLDRLPSRFDAGMEKTEEECKEELNKYLDDVEKELINKLDEHKTLYYIGTIGLSCSGTLPKLYDDEMKKRFETQRFYFNDN